MTSTFGKNGLMDFFRGRDRKNRVSTAFARILSQHDLEQMAYSSGISESRRCDAPRLLALGVLVIPCDPATPQAEIDYSQAVAAVTCDLRRQGIGVLVTQRFTTKRCIVAIPDAEAVWKFFGCECRHQSRHAGGWWQAGFHLDEMIEPDTTQLQAFRGRCQILLPDSESPKDVVSGGEHW